MEVAQGPAADRGAEGVADAVSEVAHSISRSGLLQSQNLLVLRQDALCLVDLVGSWRTYVGPHRLGRALQRAGPAIEVEAATQSDVSPTPRSSRCPISVQWVGLLQDGAQFLEGWNDQRLSEVTRVQECRPAVEVGGRKLQRIERDADVFVTKRPAHHWDEFGAAGLLEVPPELTDAPRPAARVGAWASGPPRRIVSHTDQSCSP
jgi:hypothetical protein